MTDFRRSSRLDYFDWNEAGTFALLRDTVCHVDLFRTISLKMFNKVYKYSWQLDQIAAVTNLLVPGFSRFIFEESWGPEENGGSNT